MDDYGITGKVSPFVARVMNRLVRPMGLRCVPVPVISPAPELPDVCLEHARILPERSDILHLLPTGGVVAEVGVAFGKYSRKILEVMEPRQFVAVDTFELDGPSWSGHQAYGKVFAGRSHEQYYRDAFAPEIAAGRVLVKKGFSFSVLEEFPDRYFDMVYIDAAHDYESVRRDLDVISRKVKEDGFILLNDYTLVDPLLLQPYGIVQATHEFCMREGWEIVYLALHRYMFCDVALRKVKG